MNDDGRVYFIGAGASKQDRFPLTGELKHGLAWAIREEPERFAILAKHLEYLYHVSDKTFEKSADIWENLSELPSDAPAARCQIPDVTDLLSTLDWIIREQSSFGPGLETRDEKRSPIDELPEVRDLVVQALCYCLGKYHDLHKACKTEEFVSLIRPTDSLITTNWDLLLDAARHRKFGSQPDDYGTTANVVLEETVDAFGSINTKERARPKLLKLHGSLSWRYCQRCQRLVIDPLHHVAGDRKESCECTYSYSELIVTPGFVREYRNIHLLTIWREALLALASASQWIFIGYSLPADDVGIRTLLLKGRCVRKDIGGKPPAVTIVTGSNGEATRARYLGIFADVKLFEGDFGQFVDQKGGGVL
jgi:hypothetical protein